MVRIRNLSIKKKLIIITTFLSIGACGFGTYIIVFVGNVLNAELKKVDELGSKSLQLSQEMKQSVVEINQQFIEDMASDKSRSQSLDIGRWNETFVKDLSDYKTVAAGISDQSLTDLIEELGPLYEKFYSAGVSGLEKKSGLDSAIIVRLNKDSGNIIDKIDESTKLSNAYNQKLFDNLSAKSRELIIATAVAIVGMAAMVLVSCLSLAFSISRRMKSTIAVAKNMASGEGDLTQRLDEKNKDEIGELAHWLNIFIGSLGATVSKIKETTQALSATAQQLAASSQQVNTATQQVSSGVQDVASTSQNLARETSVVGTNAKSLSEEANIGSEAAKKASEKMQALANAVSDSSRSVSNLDSKSQEIFQIIATINSIASQTNLLALNAAIEAARAGEAGRGFAVVADEVRKLAEESQGATKDIELLINEIRKSTDDAVLSMGTGKKEVEEGGQVVALALESLESIGSKILSITSAIDALTGVAQQTSDSSQQISFGVQQTGSSMKQVASAAEVLASTSGELRSLVGMFKVDDSDDYIAGSPIP